jgi:WD40 repeat protein
VATLVGWTIGWYFLLTWAIFYYPEKITLNAFLLVVFGSFVIGFSQWLVLRREVEKSFWWIIASIAGWVLPFLILSSGFDLSQFQTDFIIISTIVSLISNTFTGIAFQFFFTESVDKRFQSGVLFGGNIVIILLILLVINVDIFISSRKEISQKNVDEMSAIEFSPDGNTIATAGCISGGGSSVECGRGFIYFWDVNNLEKTHSFEIPNEDITSIKFSHDGKFLASSSYRGILRMWDVASGEPIILARIFPSVRDQEFLPEGETLVLGFEKKISIWDMEKDNISNINLSCDLSELTKSSDGKFLASSCHFRNHINIWDLETGELIDTLEGHNDWVRNIEFSPDGEMLASGSNDGTVKLWDPIKGNLIKTLQEGSEMIFQVTFSPDGSKLASSSSDNRIKVWDFESGEIIEEFIKRKGSVQCLSYSPDGSKLVAGCFDNSLRIWEVAE